ncbi:MAG: oligopeptide/dipeptide ABC transporter ATP-binding protein [Methylococcales bacterium]
MGRIVEVADALTLYDAPLHPYTRMLLQSVAVPDPRQRERKNANQLGDIPKSRDIIAGTCRFQGRCPVAVERCLQTDPKLVQVSGNGHWVACIHNETIFRR